MKRLTAMIGAVVLTASAAIAGVNIQWYVAYGIYPYLAADPTSSTPGTGLLANNGSGNTIIQLVYCGADGAADIVDPFNAGSGYVSDDDVVWSQINVSNGVGGYDEWVYNSTLPRYVNGTFTAGDVYIRIFQDQTPAPGEHYYDSAEMAVVDRGSDITQRQVLTPDTPAGGVALDKTIVPEPATFAFIGIGGLLLALRRMRRA